MPLIVSQVMKDPMKVDDTQPIHIMFYQTPLVGGIFLCAWPWVEDVSTILQFPDVFEFRFYVSISSGGFCY